MSKKIVIVGGSFAGIHASSGLEKALNQNEAEITLISRTDIFFPNIAAPRAVADKDFASKLFFPLDKLFKRSTNKIVIGVATAITKSAVVLEDGQQIPYDILVIATGSSYGSPFKPLYRTKEDGVNQLAEVSNLVVAASRIAIVGGGATGIELAAEIKLSHPDKDISLVHSSEKLLNRLKVTDGFKDKVQKKLEGLGIKVILGSPVVRDDEGSNPVLSGTRTLKTSKGEAIETDLTIFAVGRVTFNSDLVKSLSTSLLNDRGEIKVKSTFQVDDDAYPNIFAYGDVAATGAPKDAAQISRLQGPLLVSNVVSAVRGKSISKQFKASEPNMAFLALGKHDAAAEIPFMPWFLTDFIAKKLKAPYLMADKFAGDVNQVFLK